MDVILTIEPFPLVSDEAKPRAKRSGAKKFNSKTVCHASKLPFRHPRRSSIGDFGDHPALLTRPWRGLSPKNSFASFIKVSILSEFTRSAVM